MSLPAHPPAAAPRYLTRAQLIDRLAAMRGTMTLTECGQQWQVDFRELSHVLRSEQYPGERLRKVLGVGAEEVVWPLLVMGKGRDK